MSRFIKNPDEIVLEDVSMLHYEVMEQGRVVWLGIYLNNGKMYHLNIGGDNTSRKHGIMLSMSRFIKNPDEIVLEDVSMLHYEVTEQGRAVWLGIYLNDGKIYHLNIGGDNLYVNYSDETL